MVENKRKKNSRQRGTTTHGWGSMKKHRGAGHRGGKGRAGSGKKADQKKPSYWKDTKYMGAYGFHSHKPKEDIIMTNIVTLEKNISSFEKKGDSYAIDLSKAGINKLLGKGKATKKMDITVKYASQLAITKIEEAGGKVNISSKEAPATQEAPKETKE